MNAKKIMGAVLVALLAAALFVGAGAAATVFVNENVTQTQKTALVDSGTWSNGDAYVTIGSNGIVVPGPNFVPGTYKNGEESLFVTNPTAVISGVVGTGYEAYPFVGANIYQNTLATEIELSAVSASDNVTIDGLYVTFPDGSNQVLSEQDLVYELAGTNATLGVYKVQTLFNYTNFTKGILLDKLLSEAVTITVVEEGAGTISAAADSVLKSETIKLVITGQPGKTYNVTFDTPYLFNATENQLINTVKVDGKLQFEMPNTGKVDLSIKANATATEDVDSSEKITLQWNANGKSKQASVVIKFEKGTISAKTDAASYFVGDQVKVIVTSTAGIPTKYTVNGTNFGWIDNGLGTSTAGWKETGDSVKTIEFVIQTKNIYSVEQATLNKKMDAGTYTITIIVNDDVKTTVPLTMKQPFISIAEAPEVIVQGDKAEFIINAEATEKIAYYIFGTNYFNVNNNVEEHPDDDDGEPVENQFIIKLDEDTTDNMSNGQYFAVFQHPMYDGALNVTGYLTNKTIVSTNDVKIVVTDRQTANAAQALCDELDAQNIDDMYVKYSFFVVGEDESFTISEIPATIAQGETLTISGVSTANAGEYVTVEMISTAFAAVPKETVGSAAFIAVTTQIADDGTWEVTFDTSNLNVDEYSLKVACSGQDKPWKNVNIDVVEAADEPVDPEQPGDEPEQPGDEPEAPATPGFGALAALAGLGAVAVLLLRRE